MRYGGRLPRTVSGMATIRTARTTQALPAAPAVPAFAAPAADATPPGPRPVSVRTAGAIAPPTTVVLVGLAALDARTANRRTVEV
jgi:hypothetical protein